MNISVIALFVVLPMISAAAADPAPLPGTRVLDRDDDIASAIVAGADRFLLRKIEASPGWRARHWRRDPASPEKYEASVRPNRERLARILGVRDPRVPFDAPRLLATTAASSLVGRSDGYEVHGVSWPAFGDVTGEGLLAIPVGSGDAHRKPVADIVAIPDASISPEALFGIAPGVPLESQFARRLAESGCRVLVPALIDRSPAHGKIDRREFLYRSAYELGRHIIGYEVGKVLAAVDWFEKESQGGRVGLIGWGDGALLALAAAALDPRIDAACASGHFEAREDLWREPIDRNVFGLLEEFGDAEIASLVVPRPLVIEAARGPEFEVPPGTGGGPGRIDTPDPDRVRAEVERARRLAAGLLPSPRIELVESGGGMGPFGSEPALAAFLDALVPGTRLAPAGRPPAGGAPADFEVRALRMFREIDRHNQALLDGSADVRREFFAKLDTSSPEAFARTIGPYRTHFRDEVIGRFDDPFLPPDPRSRKVFDEPAYAGWEVVLDVFPDVIAYGILLVPKGIPAGERRPAVVCQHGLEGRPRDVADPAVQNPAYSRYACRLAERGFVTFAPQNLYLFGDRFRTLQRKANPLKKTLFSIIVPQHEAIVRWLGSLDFVAPKRIAFYGLSYGGKTAMRVPALVGGYCLSICSADFNEWVWKNASTRSPYSYVWTGEYEIFEFDLGSTFNYAEMAALIAPRPFMVERGHFDGVAPGEAVAYEFAKVRFLYEARLGIGDRCAIEWFVGPHSIHGVGTFEFLHKHLAWPAPARPEAGR
jgi:dienelactone hydrolase